MERADVFLDRNKFNGANIRVLKTLNYFWTPLTEGPRYPYSHPACTEDFQ